MSVCHEGSLPAAILFTPLHFLEARLAHQHLTILNLMEHFLYRGTGTVAYPGIFFRGGSTNSVEDRENGNLGGQ